MNIALVEPNDTGRIQMLEHIQTYCRGFELPTNIQQFTNEIDFVKGFSPGGFDIIFLNVDSDATLRAARILRRADSRCKLVVVSLGDRYATESYDLNAVYYLRKPIELSALKRGLERCMNDEMRGSRFIEVISGRHRKQILMSDIQYTVVSKNSIHIHTRHGMEKVYTNFRTFAPKLLCDSRFIQSYYGCIVNMDYIEQLEKNQFVLSEGKSIGIRKKGSGSIKAAYMKYSRTQARDY